MARPLKYVQQMLARFPEGTFERMDTLLHPGEDRASLVRTAVETELRRREMLEGQPARRYRIRWRG